MVLAGRKGNDLIGRTGWVWASQQRTEDIGWGDRHLNVSYDREVLIKSKDWRRRTTVLGVQLKKEGQKHEKTALSTMVDYCLITIVRKERATTQLPLPHDDSNRAPLYGAPVRHQFRDQRFRTVRTSQPTTLQFYNSITKTSAREGTTFARNTQLQDKRILHRTKETVYLKRINPVRMEGGSTLVRAPSA